MVNEFLPIGVLIILAVALAIVVPTLGYLFGPRRYVPAKSRPYESGMTPFGPGTRRVSVRYYMIAVLFILFDVEVVFFLPWAVVFKELGVPALIEMGLFALVVVVGLVYAWKKGALEWE
ncbi:MAG TPA: NADH-quinone oxidoreductase subunit A [Anaerolineaceae bacterium]|nr:NADH-quinone oxidoreductase subunit A [Anaerolineaceae bacterium]HPN50687.1 NADH-quinone oxidoreductase subunit A [Anaerolineaceae bacterium]